MAALENPKAVNDWWNGLTQAEKRALLESDPNLIGNLDGIPPGVRYEANRNSIETYVAEMEARRALGRGAACRFSWQPMQPRRSPGCS